MGVVYEAFDNHNRTRVALKMLKDADAQAIYRIKWEFRSLAQLFHRNLVQLYELYSDGSRWFFTMELVEHSVDFISFLRHRASANVRRDNTTIVSDQKRVFSSSTLNSSTARGPSSGSSHRGIQEITERTLRQPRADCLIQDFEEFRVLFTQLVEGVIALHTNHRLHRDLKPGNALVTQDGRVVLLDFGLVKEMDQTPVRAHGTASLGDTGYGSIIGTAGYMAPEQAAGLHVTEASDWYAVGVMLFEALTGRLPFSGSAATVLKDKQRQDAPLPSDLVTGIPGDLEALCVSLLRRNPTERPTGEDILSLLTSRIGLRTRSTPRPFVGRVRQQKQLAEGLALARNGSTVIAHLQGASGSGKSTLLERFLRQARAEGALVLSGRCYENELVPYKAIDAVIDALTSHLMTIPTDRLAKMVPNGLPAVARMFPVLMRIPSVQKLCADVPITIDAGAARQQAFGALRTILQRLSVRQTVVVAIDDVQWTDPESASLLANVLAGPEPPPIMVALSYRAEYLQRSESLNAIAGLPGVTSPRVHRLETNVEPFDHEEAKQLALALLENQVSDVSRHAERIAAEANGSAMFIGELAQQVLGRSGATDPQHGLDELLWQRVESLPEVARTIVELTSVAGQPLRLSVLQAAAGMSATPLHHLALLRASHLIRLEGMRTESAIEPYHDRVRESIVHHLPRPRLVECHQQLSVALEASGNCEPEVLAEHFLHAGQQAKASQYTALAAAQAVRLLAFERAERLYKRSLELAPGTIEKFSVAEQLIHFYSDSARFQDAYQLASETLSLIRWNIPDRFTPPKFLVDWLRLELRLRSRSTKALLEMPLASDEQVRLGVRLMNAVLKAAYQIRPELCVWLAVKIVHRCLDQGNTTDCAIAYMVFGAIFKGGILGRYATGYDFGRLALNLVERHQADSQRSEVNFVVGYFGTSWRRPSIEAEALWQTALTSGIATRDRFHTGCAASAIAMSHFMRGLPFAVISTRVDEYERLLTPAGLSEPLGILSALRQAMRNLRGTVGDTASFASDDFPEAEFRKRLKSYGSRHFAHCYFILKMQCCFLWGHYDEAWQEVEAADEFRNDSKGMLHSAEDVFYRGLIAATLARRGSPQRRRMLRCARRDLRRLRDWTKHCPANFQRRAQLLEAEVARCTQPYARCAQLYAIAVEAAQRDENLCLRGLSAMLAAGCAADHSQWAEADRFRSQAVAAFQAWGADGLAHSILQGPRIPRATESITST